MAHPRFILDVLGLVLITNLVLFFYAQVDPTSNTCTSKESAIVPGISTACTGIYNEHSCLFRDCWLKNVLTLLEMQSPEIEVETNWSHFQKRPTNNALQL